MVEAFAQLRLFVDDYSVCHTDKTQQAQNFT